MHFQHRVEVQLRVCDLIHHESPHCGEAGRRVDLLHLPSDLLQHRHRLFGKAELGDTSGVLNRKFRESIDVADLQVHVANEFARLHMLRVDLKSSPSPDQRLVVLPLMLIRDSDLHQNAGRSRIARERLLLATQPIGEPPERFLERPILQESLGVIRIDLERAAQAAFHRRPVPLAEKKDRATVSIYAGGLASASSRLAQRRHVNVETAFFDE
jgi:hypothetical protein